MEAPVAQPQAPSPMATAPPPQQHLTSAKNLATSRKVSRLLDITVNANLRDLVAYVDEAVPTFFDPTSACPAEAGGAATPHPHPHPQQQQQAVTVSGAATAAGLRTALEGRVTGMHKEFLEQLRGLHDTFRDVAQHVQELDRECAVMESALGGGSGGRDGPHGAVATATATATVSASPAGDGLGSFAETELLIRRVHGLQRELHTARRRQLDIKAFKERYDFGSEEQQLLESGPVDTHYLDVLEQARAVHRESRALLMSREYQQSAGAVIESTYNAIMHATEKISRFLLALSTGAGAGGGGDGGGGGVGSTSRSDAGGSSSVAADVPDVSSLYLRCARVLREENVAQWERVVEELARVRRASVLRRYFHLLTTGSATSSAGTYRASGGGGSSSSAGDNGNGDGFSSSSLRPLEAELNNPVFFFSSLFAWLHQCIVEEEDFLNLFLRAPPAATTGATETASQLTPGGSGATAATSLSKRTLLGFIFDGVTKHVRTAFDGVLDRFVKSSAVLGHTVVVSPAAVGGDGGAAASSSEERHAGSAGRLGGVEAFSPSKLAAQALQSRAPRGLTGGLTRLLFAATGRQIGSSHTQGNDSSNNGNNGSGGGILQRYAAASSRAQLEAVMAALMRGPFNGLLVCYQLLQLFSYYGAATFVPLLGPAASLTVLVVESANVELQRVLQQLVKFISLHLFDSVAGVVHRLPVLRRLSTAYEASVTGYRAAEAEESSGDRPPRRFVLDFLFKHYNLLADATADGSATSSSAGGGGGGMSTDPQQQASALELSRSLQQLILPATPEVQACLKILQQLLTDTARQRQTLEAIREQQRQQRRHQSLQPHQLGGGEAEDDAADGEDPPPYFMTVLQTLLGLPALLGAQHTAGAGLDDPCKLVLELNCFYALRAVLADNYALLRQSSLHHVSAGADADSSTSAATPSEESAETAADAAPLVVIVDSETTRLSGQLCLHLAAAAGDNYFRQARLPAALRTAVTAPATSGASKAEDGEEQRLQAQRQQAIRTALFWLYNFYNLIASAGVVPQLPLLPSLASQATQRDLQAQVAALVIAEYGEIYRQMRAEVSAGEAAGAPLLTPEEAAALADMSPEKLSILMG